VNSAAFQHTLFPSSGPKRSTTFVATKNAPLISCQFFSTSASCCFMFRIDGTPFETPTRPFHPGSPSPPYLSTKSLSLHIINPINSDFSSPFSFSFTHPSSPQTIAGVSPLSVRVLLIALTSFPFPLPSGGKNDSSAPSRALRPGGLTTDTIQLDLSHTPPTPPFS